MEMTQGNLPKKGFALSARRLTLLASVAAVGTALMLAGPNTNWSQLFNASSASAADSTAQHPAGFADLVAKVKPAVISVRVKIPASAAPAMMQDDENDGGNQQDIPAQPGSPFDKFF
jgi:serine protease Do